MPKVFLRDLTDGYHPAIGDAMAFLGDAANLRPGLRVAIKPNLTFPVYRPGVMTSIEAIEALLRHLRDHGCQVTICEADSGGYNRFSMDQVFLATGLCELAARYGARLVNLSNQDSREIQVRAGWRGLSVPLPRLLIDETDLLITMPVPKVHANTVVSGAIKNQWGVIQDPARRLKLHPYFARVIHALHQALPRTIVVMDGRHGLDRNGPMRGDATQLNWLLASDSVFHADRVMTSLIGIDWRSVPHLRFFARREPAAAFGRIEFNTDWRPFHRANFRLERRWTDAPGWCTFHSRSLAWLGYESPLAAPMHRLLYCFREPFY
ncbi:MAG: DUF362 domain-containing protein [Acidobacteriales bacterium]|nr:MAG: DUF362 domain-containing protein [Terriglobales bacterium]